MYTGLTGKLTIDNKPVAYISNWSVDSSVEIIEVAELGKATRQKAAGMRSWTASADGAVYFGDDGVTGHSALFKAMNEGATVKCDFYLYDSKDEKNNRQHYVPYSGDTTPPPAGTYKDKPSVKFEGSGLIESLSVDLSSEDKGNISISISGCGDLRYPGQP